MTLSLIAAMGSNRVIGKDGGLPWHLSADLKRFKLLTLGHHLIMGRRTFESIGRPLPGRTTVVLSRGRGPVVPGVLVAGSLEGALQLAACDPEPFVAGGGQIYQLALPVADRLYLTVVDAQVEGDTYFPAFDSTAWTLESAAAPDDPAAPFPYRFEIHRRAG